MPYDMPMSLDEVFADEEARREAMRFLGVPDAPAAASNAAPQPTSAPAPTMRPPSFDELAREYEAAQMADAQQRRLNQATEGFGNAAETILGGAGVRYARSNAPEPSAAADVLRGAQTKAEIEKAARPAGTTKPTKAVKSTDPKSPESKRVQANLLLSYPGLKPEDVATVSEADADRVAIDLGKRFGRDVTREGIDAANTRASNQIASTQAENALNRRQRWAAIQQAAEQFGASQGLKERLAQMEFDEKKAAREDKQADKAAETSVPGFEPAPGATPVKSDAETLKKTTAAAAKMRRHVATLRDLHAKYGETPKGAGANLQQQALRAIQLEAKNIADLGALSGPDFGLMQDLSAEDLNTLPAFLRRSFGGASLEESIQGLERWMENTIAGTAEGHGYQPKRVPATRALPTDATGKPTLDDSIPPAPKLAAGQKLVDALIEGQMVRVPMGGGKNRVVVKRDGKLKIVEGK